MALAEVSELQDVGVVQAEALMTALAYNHPDISVPDRADLRAELDGSLAIIQEYLRGQAACLVVDLSDIQQPNERTKILQGEFDPEKTGQLWVPRSCITAITLNALWGEADCNPIADVRIVAEEDRCNPSLIYGKDPVESVGRWSRFPIGQLIL